VGDGELEHPEEHHSAAPGAAAVEPEDELVQIADEVGVLHRPLMSPQEPALRERRNPMDCRQQLVRVVSASPCSSLATTVVNVSELLQTAVPLPAVRDHPGAWFDVVRNERMERAG
jgi:hypothetical protein